MADRPVVLLGVTGGIAAYKAAELLRGLQKAGMEVRVIMTRAATKIRHPHDLRGTVYLSGPVG